MYISAQVLKSSCLTSQTTAVTVPLGGKEHSAQRQFPPVILSTALHTSVAKERPVFPCLMDTPATVL